MEYKNKTIIGLSEKVTNYGKKKRKTVRARIETGATKSSIDVKLAAELNLGPVIKSKLVKSAHGNKLRPVIRGEVKLAGKKIKGEFTLADRTHMKYGCLIGQNLLKEGFLINPSKR